MTMPIGTHAAGRTGRPRSAAEERLLAVRRSWTGVHEIGLFVLFYVVYFGVRALTEGHRDVAIANAVDLFDVERVLGVDWEAALQGLILERHALVDVANALYIWGHWPLLIGGGVLLFHLSRPHYFDLRNVCVLSGALGLIIFGLFPVAPPRLAALGLQDTVTLHADAYRSVLPASLVNEYAAMPSFHAGWNLLLGIALWRAGRHPAVRAFALLMPAAMAFAVMATGNHFLLDVVAGAAIIVVAVVAVDRLGPRHVALHS